ncbi:hypothetical protein ACKVMT_14835 [Halobacteriales archaeon Cl-PHB]
MADDDEPVAGVAIALGLFVTWLSIAATAVLATDEYLIAGLQSSSQTAQDLSGLGIFFLAGFLFGIAPFFAVAMWANVHDVAVLTGGSPTSFSFDPVPLVGVVDGGLEPFAVVLLVLVGAVTASEVAETVVGRAVGGTAAGTFGYVSVTWLFMMLSALVYNFGADVINSLLAGMVGVAGDVDLFPFIVYPDTVGAAVSLLTFAAPLIAVGAVGNAVLTGIQSAQAGIEGTPQSRNSVSGDDDSQGRRGTGSTANASSGTSGGVSDRSGPTAGRESPAGRGASADSEADPAADPEGTPVTTRDDADPAADSADEDADGRWREEWYDEDRRRDDRS